MNCAKCSQCMRRNCKWSAKLDCICIVLCLTVTVHTYSTWFQTDSLGTVFSGGLSVNDTELGMDDSAWLQTWFFFILLLKPFFLSSISSFGPTDHAQYHTSTKKSYDSTTLFYPLRDSYQHSLIQSSSSPTTSHPSSSSWRRIYTITSNHLPIQKRGVWHAIMGLRSPSLVSSQQEDPTSVESWPFLLWYQRATSWNMIPLAQSPNQPLTEEQVELLSTFRAELTTEGHLADGDTLGTDDETLMYDFWLGSPLVFIRELKRMM